MTRLLCRNHSLQALPHPSSESATTLALSPCCHLCLLHSWHACACVCIRKSPDLGHFHSFSMNAIWSQQAVGQTTRVSLHSSKRPCYWTGWLHPIKCPLSKSFFFSQTTLPKTWTSIASICPQALSPTLYSCLKFRTSKTELKSLLLPSAAMDQGIIALPEPASKDSLHKRTGEWVPFGS